MVASRAVANSHRELQLNHGRFPCCERAISKPRQVKIDIVMLVVTGKAAAKVGNCIRAIIIGGVFRSENVSVGDVAAQNGQCILSRRLGTESEGIKVERFQNYIERSVVRDCQRELSASVLALVAVMLAGPTSVTALAGLPLPSNVPQVVSSLEPRPGSPPLSPMLQLDSAADQSMR